MLHTSGLKSETVHYPESIQLFENFIEAVSFVFNLKVFLVAILMPRLRGG
jgi:hypothetical protein